MLLHGGGQVTDPADRRAAEAVAPSAAPLPPPRLVAWETTKACNLVCRHCRAEAVPESTPEELSPLEGRELLTRLAEWAPKPMVILSGGEPLMRPDVLELASLGTSLGLRMLLSTNGTLLNAKTARLLKKAGVARLSLSLDAETAAEHDSFRGVQGSFDAVASAAAVLREIGLPFQINSAVTPDNVDRTEKLSDAALALGAAAHHVFLLVPVGRARDWDVTTVPAEKYEAALIRLKRRESSLKLGFKATCAPQYARIGRQLGLAPSPGSGRGCLGGQGFMFVAHDGRVGACGYLPLPAGDVRVAHPAEIYSSSPLFLELRDRARYHGRCRVCEHFDICGGCRARAHAAGDHLGPEPLCPHQPARRRSES
jgi:radical SAM protein with 4Fe4S-binding SPASM domain